jgi:hypothetical protein
MMFSYAMTCKPMTVELEASLSGTVPPKQDGNHVLCGSALRAGKDIPHISDLGAHLETEGCNRQDIACVKSGWLQVYRSANDQTRYPGLVVWDISFGA